MIVAVIILALLLIVAVGLGYREILDLRGIIVRDVADIVALQNKVKALEAQAAKPKDLVINDVPVKYDAESKTVCVEGNLVATGFIACASKGGNCDA
jgi:hypothetical protein